jgi:hypothetical protein
MKVEIKSIGEAYEELKKGLFSRKPKQAKKFGKKGKLDTPSKEQWARKHPK